MTSSLKMIALSFAAATALSSTALGETASAKIAFSNNYAGNSWRQAMLKSYEIVVKKVERMVNLKS